MNDLPIVIVRWRALSLKRLAYLSELQRTERWRHHFRDQGAFEEALRAADADAENWKRIAYSDNPMSVEVVD